MAQNPTWYDILGVDRDATPEQIKAAWRSATDKFEPGSGTSQFRLFNEAADVLLDPARRTAYDAELDGTGAGATEPLEPETGPVAEPETEPEPEIETGLDEPTEPEPGPGPEAEPGDEPTEPAKRGLGSAVLDPLSRLPIWGVGILAGLALVAVVTALVLAFGISTPVEDVDGLTDRVAVADAGPEASSAAERALKQVLSYDYRHMEADRDRAAQFLTPSYRKEYLKNFNDLLIAGPDGGPGPAVKTKAVVTADVLDTGVVDASRDRVRVIAFVNQSSVKGDAAPTILQNRLVVTMVQRGDDWQIDNIKSY
jgi:Mce-associated membrane protein